MRRAGHCAKSQCRPFFFPFSLLFLGILFLTPLSRLYALNPDKKIIDLTYADLSVEDILFLPVRLTPQSSITVTAVIRNNGTKPASEVMGSVKIFQDGKLLRALLDTPILADLPGNGSSNSILMRVGRLAAGAYQVSFEVNPSRAIEERNVDNNVLIREFTVYTS
jgi:hypothetical protein